MILKCATCRQRSQTNKHRYDGKDDDADGDNLVGENRANVPPKVDVVKGGDSFYCNAKNECCEENRKTRVEKEFYCKNNLQI